MILHSEYNKYWQAHRDWIEQFEPQIIFTGHVKLGAAHYTKDGKLIYERISDEKLTNEVGYYIKQLSRTLFGTTAVHNGASLSYVGRIEGVLNPNRTGNPRLHVHLAVGGIPDHEDLNVFGNMMCRIWEDRRFGYRDTLAEPCYGDAWKNYFLKSFSPYDGKRFITNVHYRERDQ